MSRVSIIIPTSRTGPRLGACLESIARQRLDPHEIDVHVVYNGVADPPLWRRENWPFRLFVDRIEQANISAAKNVALNAARGDWLLLINDDVILDGEFVAAHLEAHWRLGSPAMVLGLAAWKRYADETVFDRMVQTTSMVFFYDRMTAHRWYGFRHAWNLNLSVKREWIGDERFAEQLAPVFFDDIEFAFRLERGRGLRVWYAPEARSTHDHRFTLKQYLARERRLGQMAVRLWRANPDCFRAIYDSDLDDPYIEQAHTFITRESRREAELHGALEILAARPMADMGVEQAVEEALIRALYHAHLPLKRLAFYRGLLAKLEEKHVGAAEPVLATT